MGRPSCLWAERPPFGSWPPRVCPGVLRARIRRCRVRPRALRRCCRSRSEEAGAKYRDLSRPGLRENRDGSGTTNPTTRASRLRRRPCTDKEHSAGLASCRSRHVKANPGSSKARYSGISPRIRAMMWSRAEMRGSRPYMPASTARPSCTSPTNRLQLSIKLCLLKEGGPALVDRGR